jgi:argininosuccinate lyase
MSFIWQKEGTSVDERILRFTAGEDVILDRKIFRYDIQASIAHVEGLERIDVLTADERDSLVAALRELDAAFVAGDFTLDERFEDGHSAIEAYLIEKLGDAGRKVHTGRSRNDQVLVATRLYMKDVANEAAERCVEIARIALERAGELEDLAMPGYTHLQPAVPSSAGMWFAAFSESFIDNAWLMYATRSYFDANPLGTAAGYGVNLPLDREYTSQALGFRRMQISPIYAQNSRGKFELQLLDGLGQAMLDVRRMAWDLSLWTTAEFALVDLPDSYTTGSSIMPNKRNPDVVELLRAAWGVLNGSRAELVGILSLPSGYHRDLQNSKPALVRGVEKALDALALIPALLENLTFDRERCLAAIGSETFATDKAIELTAQGVPFRDAYRQVAASLDELGGRSAKGSLDARKSPGGAANLQLDKLEERLAALTLEQ